MLAAGPLHTIWGMAGRQCKVQTLPPTSGLTVWNHEGAKRFEILWQKDIPGVSGKWVSVSITIWKLLSPNRPVGRLLILRYLPSPVPGARRFLGNGVKGCNLFSPFSSGDYKDQNSFRSRAGAGFSGSQSVVRGGRGPDA